MKTIKDWLSELPEPYRTQALVNHKNNKWCKTSEDLTNALMYGFDWVASPEGCYYWNDLYAKIKKGMPLITNALSAIHAIALKKGFPAEEIMSIRPGVGKTEWWFSLNVNPDEHFINLSTE